MHSSKHGSHCHFNELPCFKIRLYTLSRGLGMKLINVGSKAKKNQTEMRLLL